MRRFVGRVWSWVNMTLFEPSVDVTERLTDPEQHVDYLEALRYRGSARRGE